MSKASLREIVYLINFMDTDSRYSRISNIEMIAKHILKKAEEMGDEFTKALAHKVIGRLFYEKGMFESALAQFERALSSYEEVLRGKEIDEFSAKLYTWIGLSALRTNEYKKAANAFKIAINYLEKSNKNRFIIGELKALLGDALSYVEPENALIAFEEAHELMKESPTVLFISNGLKLFSALVFRRYFNEASSILAEVSENVLRAIKGMDISVYQSIRKIYKGPFLKALRIINLNSVNEIKHLLGGVEGIKGIYFTFRYFLKPLIRIKDLATYNQAIIVASRLVNDEYIDEVISRKNKFLRLYDLGNLTAYKLKNRYGFTRLSISLDTIIQMIRLRYRNIMLISLTKLDVPQEYLLLALEYPSNNIIIKRINIDIDEVVYCSKHGKEIDLKINSLLPVEIENRLLRYDEQDIVIFSVDKSLHEIPWEILNIGKSGKVVGLVTNIIRVPTLIQVPLWKANYYDFKIDKIAVVDVLKSKKIMKKITSSLKKRNYRVYIGEDLDANFLVNEHINLLFIANELRDTLGDEVFIKIGNAFFSNRDIEKLDMSGDLVILATPYAMEVHEDNLGYSFLPNSFLMSGYKSVLIINSSLSIKDYEILIDELSNLNERKNTIADVVLMLKRKIYSLGKKWWQNIALYGSPLVML